MKKLHVLASGTAMIPEKAEKNAGRDEHLPLYASGPASVGWWAMFITMVGDATAFASLVFAYFFYWTIHPDFPPPDAQGPGLLYPLASTALALAAWACMVLARRTNRQGGERTALLLMAVGVVMAAGSGAALVYAPWVTGLEPTTDVYPATVWVLASWTAVHIAVGILMQGYCMARSLAGKLTAKHDIDLQNVTLYWHFAMLTVVITVLVIAIFPLAA